VATNGTQQVGDGLNSLGGQDHALIWSGTASSAVDLNPSGYAASVALGISPNVNQQVGWASSDGDALDEHAALWTGTASSFLDLNPAGSAQSAAYAANGTQQVGFASATPNAPQAYLWYGTAASAVDLNPLGTTISDAFATNGSEQVGYADVGPQGKVIQAYAWFGSANSGVDLQGFLPGTINTSIAYDVDNLGDVFGVANGSYDNVSGEFAVEWSPVSVPEPGSAIIVLFSSALLLARSRCHMRRT
jgi:hypothetical protein